MKYCPFARTQLNRTIGSLGLGLAAVLIAAPPALASSHREAPYISGQAQLDATDLYMFRSYESGDRKSTRLNSSHG